MLWVIERRVMEKRKESDRPVDEILGELLASLPAAEELLRKYRLRPP